MRMENYKKYFLGKRYKSAGYRLAVALLLFLYGVIIASQRSIHPYLTPCLADFLDECGDGVFRIYPAFFASRSNMGRTLGKNSCLLVIVYSIGK